MPVTPEVVVRKLLFSTRIVKLRFTMVRRDALSRPPLCMRIRSLFHFLTEAQNKNATLLGDILFCGEGGESRTRVRKHFHEIFSERS